MMKMTQSMMRILRRVLLTGKATRPARTLESRAEKFILENTVSNKDFKRNIIKTITLVRLGLASGLGPGKKMIKTRTW